MDNYNYFKNTIKKINKRIFWFDFKGKLIFSGLTKKDTLKNLKNKFKNSNTKYIRLVISFHSGTKFYQGGRIQINLKTYSDKLKSENIKGMNGSYWISDYWLKNNNINTKKKLLSLLSKVVKKNVKSKNILIPGINLIRKLL